MKDFYTSAIAGIITALPLHHFPPFNSNNPFFFPQNDRIYYIFSCIIYNVRRFVWRLLQSALSAIEGAVQLCLHQNIAEMWHPSTERKLNLATSIKKIKSESSIKKEFQYSWDWSIYIYILSINVSGCSGPLVAPTSDKCLQNRIASPSRTIAFASACSQRLTTLQIVSQRFNVVKI